MKTPRVLSVLLLVTILTFTTVSLISAENIAWRLKIENNGKLVPFHVRVADSHKWKHPILKPRVVQPGRVIPKKGYIYTHTNTKSKNHRDRYITIEVFPVQQSREYKGAWQSYPEAPRFQITLRTRPEKDTIYDEPKKENWMVLGWQDINHTTTQKIETLNNKCEAEHYFTLKAFPSRYNTFDTILLKYRFTTSEKKGKHIPTLEFHITFKARVF